MKLYEEEEGEEEERRMKMNLGRFMVEGEGGKRVREKCYEKILWRRKVLIKDSVAAL